MPYCPRCRFEYRAGVRRCPDCGAALVARLPREPSHTPAAGPEAAAVQEAGALLVTVTGEVHARLLQDALRTQGIISRLQAVDNPLLPAWIPPPVTASEQRSFAVYVRAQDLSLAREVHADLESPVEQAEEDAEPEEEEGPEPPPFDLMRYLRGLYGREIPRLLKDLRWYLLVVVVLDCVATVVGYRLGVRSDSPARYPGAPLPAWMYPFLGSADSAPSWLGLFFHNALLAVYHYLWGAVSLGLLAVRAIWMNSHRTGWATGYALDYAQAAAGSGIAGTAAGLLLPHSVLETPAFWLAWALGLRAGLVWIRPLPGMRRWQSAAAVFGQFRLALLAVIPMLFVAAILETEANPWLYSRYVVGVGRAPGMAREQQLGRGAALGASAWSPDGNTLAVTDMSGRFVGTMDADGELHVTLRSDSRGFESPTWSPDGTQLAVISEPLDADSELFAGPPLEPGPVKLGGGPRGHYRHAAWHPSNGRIGVLAGARAVKGAPTQWNLWLVDPVTGYWQQLTHLPAGGMSQYGFSWSPDGRQVAFARQAAPKSHSTQLWVMDSDGGHPRRLTTGTRDAWPAWSPDGKWIAFLALPPLRDRKKADAAAGRSTRLAHICLIRADGTDRREGLAKTETFSSLSWSPDVTKLLYQRLGTLIAGTPKGL